MADVTGVSGSYTLPECTFTAPEGKQFKGWATSANGEVITGTSINVTANTTLFAVWQAKAPVVVSDDLIGNAVLKSVKQANDRFSDMKSAVVSAVDQVNKDNKYLTDAQLQQVKNIVNDMVKVEDVKANFTSGDNKTEREVTWNVALNVKEDQAVSVIEQANKIANAIITGNTSKPTPDDIDGFLTSVKNAVESKTGIVLTDKSLQEIKTQVVDKLKTEGKSLWANFHDGKGNYVCGDVKVDFNGKPYATIKVGDGNTTLEGSKSQIAKELGTAISKEIYKQMKEQGAKEGYTSQLKFTIGVNMNFGSSANPEIAAKTAKYANDYQVTVVANLNSNGLLEYKYDEGNYLRLNITQKIQEAYNDGLDQIAKQYAYTDGTKDKVVAEAKKQMETHLSVIYPEIETSLKKYDITLTHATEDALKAALSAKADKWVEKNWDALVASATNGGTLTGLDNTALINAAWELIEKDIDALTVEKLDALIQNQISKKLTEKKINEAWIVDKANNHKILSMAKALLVAYPDAKITPPNIQFNIENVGHINAILAEPVITVETPIADATVKGPAVRKAIYDQAKDELDSALTSSATLQDLLAKNPDLKNYLIYSALVQVGLDFGDEKTAAAGKDNAVLKNLIPTIKTEGKAKLEAKLNDKLATIDVSSILNDGSAEKAEYQKKIDLLNSLKFNAANGIQTKTASELAAALKGDTMMGIVGSKGDKYVAQYVEKLVNKAQALLPDGATVTIAGVTLTENDLNELKTATTTQDAVKALANLIEKFGDLSINDFAGENGQKVTVNYNGRTASANLIINVA